ncbi:putative zinc protease [Alphaproteobacteria bacterium SO-S41]|nr:putative zinc protease [Alphaproteobacteria bacterium SO-S41]
MKLEIAKLPNGLTVVTDPMPHIETASVGVWVEAGARHETAATNGVSHLLEHMAFKGTTTRSARGIAEEIESVGGYLNAYTSREQTCFYARVMKQDVPLGVDILSDILINPLFDAEELAREKKVVLQEIGQSEDTPDDIIYDHLQDAAFPGQPLGRPILGSEKTVNALGRAALRKHLATNYVGPSMTIVASGRVKHSEIVALASEKFAAIQNAEKKDPPRARYKGGDRRKTQKLEQAHLTFGVEGPAVGDPDAFAAQVFATAFGGGMSSRLFQEVREKRGLAYSVHAFAHAFVDTGFFGVYAGTGAKECAEIAPVVVGELEAMAVGATEEEAARARAQAKSALFMGLEGPSARAEHIAGQLSAYGRVMPAAEIAERIEAVDAAALRRFATRLLKSKSPSVAALGPVKGLEPYARFAARFG